MQFKELEWKDITSDNMIVCSQCEINFCGWIKIEFRINHEPKENKKDLYTSDFSKTWKKKNIYDQALYKKFVSGYFFHE